MANPTAPQVGNSGERILKKLQNPILQAALVFALILVFDISSMLLQSLGVEIEQRFPWTVSASFILFFAIFNSLTSILSKDLENYWGRSIMSYMALAALAGLAAYLLSSLSINEAGPYRWLYIVLTFGYLTFLSIIGFIKRIVEFAQKEEWNDPKIRRRKK